MAGIDWQAWLDFTSLTYTQNLLIKGGQIFRFDNYQNFLEDTVQGWYTCKHFGWDKDWLFVLLGFADGYFAAYKLAKFLHIELSQILLEKRVFKAQQYTTDESLKMPSMVENRSQSCNFSYGNELHCEMKIQKLNTTWTNILFIQHLLFYLIK